MTADPQQIARRYSSGDRATVEPVLAPDFRFAGGEMAIEGRDAFLSAGAFPAFAAP